ncbi:MAG TPA: SDR family NAD(P)-dependent oxidoreductase [Candidatus Binatia bacterium]|jgi:NAD(P)-dependent dehydrogenase (short-subunit alcohol dehydrogenase family)|nr:SDR family NAD(P)-dependent oxidoreductase [Candidatus Binatia bacterium]
MSKLLDGKVAVVTGSGRGIGRGIALALAREGAKVVVNDIGCGTDGRGTDADPASVVCKEIKELGSEGVPNYESVADYESAGKIIKTATDTWGRCDILVNNAGILRDKQLVNMTPDDFDAVLKVHLYGGFNCSQHALTVMREQKYGRIINIVSSAGLRGNFGQANYGAAKAGLMGLTFVIAVEHMKGNAEGKYSITANALSPAGMTRMVGQIPGMEGRPVPPEMNPDLNGAMVAFVASEKAAHVNGQVFGRRGYAFTLFQTPKPLAAMYREGGWTADEIAKNFDAAFAEHLNVPGIPMTQAMKDAAKAAAAAKKG